jgi:two-component system, chemotaxis family, CheB/CheR fusion protein
MPAGDQELFGSILTTLQGASGIDFSLYREKMIKRRILRRLALRSINSLAEYSERLKRDPDELAALQNDLLIAVTSFFRDPEAFERLKRVAFPASSRDGRKFGHPRLGSGLRHGRRGLLDCHLLIGISE